MYTVKNFRTKKELAAAVAEGDVEVQLYTNNGFFREHAGEKKCIEMPHAPEPHRAYAQVTVVEKDGSLFIPKGSKVK